MVRIDDLFPFVGTDQSVALTPIELALLVYAMIALDAEGVDADDIDDMQALIDSVIAKAQGE